MNDMTMNGSLTVNEIPYRLLHLLGKGKGGYSFMKSSAFKKHSITRFIGKKSEKNT